MQQTTSIMKRLLLVVFASMIAYIAFAQESYIYTITKDIANGVEYEGSYTQYQIIFNEGRLQSTPLNVNFTSTYLYSHQENGWSIYYYAVWNSFNGRWIVSKDQWYSVSPDKKTINCPSVYTYSYQPGISVLKQGVQNKSVGTMYE